ncbi:MAG: FadR family transcriptional regulator [Deltaproteobacteria bacterium]|nr:FadR family transcriptional regulator [Deltaproteobacteria bacterium]
MPHRFRKVPQLPKPARLPDQVADFLTREIDGGGLAPGDKLPSESELARQFGVSRTVIREALARLKQEGLLDSRQGQGITVQSTPREVAFRLAEVDHTNLEEVGFLYELRVALEGEASSLAARRRGEADLAELRRNLEAMAQAVAEGGDGTAPDTQFHHGLATAAGNPFLTDLMQYLDGRLRGIIARARAHSSRQPGLPPLVQREHEAIFAAIEKQDARAAREAMLSHLGNAARRLGLDFPEGQD